MNEPADPLEGFVFRLLLQLIVIISTALIGGKVFRLLGQPRVVGEILAGLLLGPSFLGMIYPDILNQVFPPSSDLPLRLLGQIGLILLMFDVGLSFDFGHLRHVRMAAVNVAVVGIVAPFALAVAVALAMHATFASEYGRLPFVLFVATAVSITAIPILGRIMMDLKREDTTLGVLTISAAAIDDVLGWILLAVVSGLVTSGFSFPSLFAQILGLAGFLAVSFLVIRPLADRVVTRLDWQTPREPIVPMAILILAVMIFAIATNLLGVFSVFGPFVLGACLSHHEPIRHFYQRSASPLVGALLLPVFFTFTGLRTDIGSLDATGWLWCGVILTAACAGKMGGCGLVMRWSGYSWRDSTIVATMMNTRALMGLVAINVGRDLNAIPDTVFSMLVVTAIATTVVTVPILKRLWVADPTDSNPVVTD